MIFNIKKSFISINEGLKSELLKKKKVLNPNEALCIALKI